MPFFVRHLDADVALDVPRESVRGVVTLDIERRDDEADEIVLDAVAFDVNSVSVGGKQSAFTNDGARLTIPISRGAKATQVVVSYKAKPRRGMYFLRPDEDVPDRPLQVWTQCQEEDARHWLPCVDKPHAKMTTSVTVRAPRGWTVLSNGELTSKRDEADGVVFRWEMNLPHPSYLLTIVAGEFAEIEAQAGHVPLSYLVPQDRRADGVRTFEKTPKMVEYFGQITGVPYPWNKYAQVVVSDFVFGGMENTTATTMYEHILLDERAAIDITSDDLIAHELAHQWFGDFVTCRDWSEGWLNEGFATFMEHVWREHDLGVDEYQYALERDLESYASEANGRYRRAIVCRDYDAPLDLFDRHLYEKGGLVLHMLRHELGSERFWRGVAAYLTKHAHGLVETRDLQRALEDVSGRSLGRFFDQWVYKPGHPDLDVAIHWEKKRLMVTVKQTQSATDGVPNAFEFPLVFDAVKEDGSSELLRISISQRSEAFVLPLPLRPAFVIVDPDMLVLGELTVRAPNDMLRSQLAKAAAARGRWMAARILAKSTDSLTIAALGKRLHDEGEFWGVRAECAAALGRIKTADCLEILSASAGVAHPKVRRAVVEAIGSFRTTAAAEAVAAHAQRDASYLVEAEAARSIGKIRRDEAFERLTGMLDRPSWADVVRVGAVDGLAALRDERAVDKLLPRLRYGNSERVRRAVLMALPKLTSQERVREIVEELLDDPNPHVRLDAARSLGKFDDVKARPALRARIDTELDPRARRRMREVVRDLGGESKAAMQSLRDDFDKLQTEYAELKLRLAKIEATKAEAAPRTPKSRAAHVVPSGRKRGVTK